MAQAVAIMKAPFDRTEWFGLLVIATTIAAMAWIGWQIIFQQ